MSPKQPLTCRECGKSQEELGNVKISPTSKLCRICALKHMTAWEKVAKDKGKEVKEHDEP